MRVALPTEQQVADLHEHLLAKDGGLPGSRVGTSIGAIAEKIQTNLVCRFESPSVQQGAPFAVYAFTIGHPFNDANKRTALSVGDLILLMNDERVVRTEYQIELADQIIDLAAGNISQDQFTERYIELLERGGERPESGAL